VELAITKYCSVRDSLAADIAVEYAVTVNGEAGERRPATAPAAARAAAATPR
jgi:hypothetical protein